MREKGGLAARRLTPSNALGREEVQPDLGKRTRRVPKSTNPPKGHGLWAESSEIAFSRRKQRFDSPRERQLNQIVGLVYA